MHEKESSTLLRGCTQLTHWHSHYKRCQCYQVKDKPVDLHTTGATRDPCSCDIDTQCHQICHPSKQTTYQYFDGCNGEDTSGYNNPLQYHTFSLQQYQLPSNHTTCQISLGQPLGFITLHVRNSPSHHGLYQCSHYRNILTTYSTCSRSEEDAEVH